MSQSVPPQYHTSLHQPALTTTGSLGRTSYELTIEVGANVDDSSESPVGATLRLGPIPQDACESMVRLTPSAGVTVSNPLRTVTKGEEVMFDLTLEPHESPLSVTTAYIGQEPFELSLPTAHPVRSVAKILREAPGAIETHFEPSVEDFYADGENIHHESIWRVCKSIVEGEALVNVLGGLVAANGAFASEHYYRRYEFIANQLATADDTGGRTESVHALRAFLQSYNADERLADVEFEHLIGELLTTDEGPVRRSTLLSYGVNIDEEFVQSAGYAYWLAQTVNEDGIEAARASILDAPHDRGPSVRAARCRAEQAEQGERAEKWRQTLGPTARTIDDGDLAYCLAQHFSWTARETETHAQGQSLLFGIASSLFERTGANSQAAKATVEALHTRGHERRYQRDIEKAVDKFERAYELALELGDQHLIRNTRTSLASAEGRLCLEGCDIQAAIAAYDRGLDDLESDVDDVPTRRSRALLRAKRNEAVGRHRLSTGEDGAVAAIKAAIIAYRFVGKDRSVDRCHRLKYAA